MVNRGFAQIIKDLSKPQIVNPQVANAIIPEQADAVHTEIANHVSDGLKTHT